MSKLIIISAPSGAGKTTIVKEIMKNEALKLMFSCSATNRKPRQNETDGKDYFFLSTDNFKNKIKNEEFIEWEEVYKDQFYGTLKSEIQRIAKLNKNIIFDVDVKGGINIKNQYENNSLSIFIKPPSIQELKNRLINRGTETEETVNKRIQKAEYELSFAEKFDLIVTNDILEEAINQVNNAIRNFISS